VFTGARINSYSKLSEVVMLPDCHVGRKVRLSRCVVDAGVNIPEGLVVGENVELDRKRFRVSEKGIALITQDMINRLQM
jgi:glucose-1-phosphate adenylyltransferase